jgi:hypothetical protein
LVSRVYAARGGEFTSRGRPYALSLFGSVALVVCLMRTNITQAFAGAIFGVSQATVSRRWHLLRPVIALRGSRSRSPMLSSSFMPLVRTHRSSRQVWGDA